MQGTHAYDEEEEPSMKKIDLIRALEEAGVLGREQCPEKDFWRWPVRIPEALPPAMKEEYDELGEIRWHGGEDL